MNYGGAITWDIARLLDLFSAHCPERATLDWLRSAFSDRAKWKKAHGVHGQIRNKALMAERTGNATAKAQYLFEEVCAKTLYNLSGAAAPFDSDSPYWVLPNAIGFARRVGVPEAAVLACITIQAENAPSPPAT